MVTSTTNGITVKVETQYLPAHSDPIAGKFLFGYHITIENGSACTVQLMRRHWKIWDSNNVLREVEGEGVVGMQPVLAPGEAHGYSSYCNLFTEIGKMSGNYLMRKVDDNAHFEVAIPEFRMIAPLKLN